MLVGLSLGQLLIYIVVGIALCMIAYIIVTKGFKVTIPDWVIQIFWILVAVVVFYLAVRFLLSL